jgi:hypothetical protein
LTFDFLENVKIEAYNSLLVWAGTWSAALKRFATAASTFMHFSNFTLFVWLVADGWCWFVLREKYC